MARPIKFNTDHNFAEGRELLSPLLVDMMNQQEVESGFEDEAGKLGFTNYNVGTPDGIITSMIGPEPLAELGEDEVAPILKKEQGYEKPYELKTYAGRTKVTKVFAEWIKKGAQHIEAADSSVKNELNKLVADAKYLQEGAMLTKNELVSQVFAKGFSITAGDGAGSASPDGKALFADDHLIKRTGGTYDNLISGALTASTLQSAIELHKTGIKMGSGRRVRTPGTYDLIIPRALETAARKLLNDLTAFSGDTSNTNSNIANEFMFENNRVRLVINDQFGQIGEDGNVIGSDVNWFVLNRPLAEQLKAFRVMVLWDNELKIYENDDTDAMFVKLSLHMGVDFYQPECIVGSTGV